MVSNVMLYLQYILICQSLTSSDCDPMLGRYSQEPTAEEEIDMTRLIDMAEGVSKSIPENDPTIKQLVGQAKETKVDLHSDKGIKQATTKVYDLLNHAEHEIDLPKDKDTAKRQIGSLVASNRSMAFNDLVPHVAHEFGFKKGKEEKIAQNREALLAAVKCHENAPLVTAFQELVDLCSEENDRRLARVYFRAVQALRDVEYVITEDNARQLSKGKTKVPGIGKKIAEHIVEFLRTGTMEKLEQKRAEVR